MAKKNIPELFKFDDETPEEKPKIIRKRKTKKEKEAEAEAKKDVTKKATTKKATTKKQANEVLNEIKEPESEPEKDNIKLENPDEIIEQQDLSSPSAPATTFYPINPQGDTRSRIKQLQKKIQDKSRPYLGKRW
ncbi:MAG: hypothetical protein ACC656_02700 [Candidatus Heimdallarchaeota archaeon]